MIWKKIMVFLPSLIIIGGIGLLVLAIIADYIGFGDVDPDHYVIGFKQMAGMAVGLASIFTGILWIWIRKKKQM
ncbi:MAG: hypothetical protein CSB21_03935 [Deltaproteobacteria bacterium]|nr:MAG: hypothetical protein CSB21_03935 [Deltaproteobacteria bacterium]